MSILKLPSALEVDKTARLIEHKIFKDARTSLSSLRSNQERIVRNAGVSSHSNANILLLLKCENLQRTGSYKCRGASHYLAKLKDEELAKGVVPCSTGNK